MWLWIAILAALAGLGLATSLISLWEAWTDDPLRSIGMLIVPAALILTLRVWRQNGWELRGSWWGLLPAALGLAMSAFRHKVAWALVLGQTTMSFMAPKFALYLVASGVVLLFAGTRVWRRAWFPLLLFLCAQPVPYFAVNYIDLPLQSLSAHIARAFAVLIGFPPTSKELLRLMFTPDFGMFIAPGCDGVRGALTLGYLALITGYLKRVSVWRWTAYVGGGALLGYLFNLIRLCALVLYYRMAVGHPRMEHFAKWADYIIGGCLFLVAALLFLWVISRKDEDGETAAGTPERESAADQRQIRLTPWRAAAFTVVVLIFVLPAVNAIRAWRPGLSATVRKGIVTPAQLDARLPTQLGSYTLARAWQEAFGSPIAMEIGAYRNSSPGEAILGVWFLSREHNPHDSWVSRGEDPQLRGSRIFLTAQQQPTQFDTAFYSDGVRDSIAGNAYCTPEGCVPSQRPPAFKIQFDLNPPDFDSPGRRAVSVFFRIDQPHSSADPKTIDQQLTASAQRFLASVDPVDLSSKFQ